jgi:putative oxidoreductase
MDRLYSRFPGGSVGFGLLLLRLAVAAWLFEIGKTLFEASPISFFFSLVLIGSALLLIPGIATSASASLGAICSTLSLLASAPDQWFPVLSLAALSISLALLGPGSYSLDARLSGWRTIDLSSRPPSDRLGS